MEIGDIAFSLNHCKFYFLLLELFRIGQSIAENLDIEIMFGKFMK